MTATNSPQEQTRRMSPRVPTPLEFSLVAASALLAGCGGGAEAIEVDGMAVLIDHDYDGSMDALLEGRLTNIGGCLGVEQSEGPGSFAVIWLEGTEVVREDPFTVRLSNGSEYALGDTVKVGGGQGGFLDREGDVKPEDFCPGVLTWREG